MIMLKHLIILGVIVAGTSSAAAGQDAVSAESSQNHMKALGAAQIGPSFRKKRENERHRREGSDTEEDNLLIDAQKNAKTTEEELEQIIRMHGKGVKKSHEESHKETQETETDQSTDTGAQKQSSALKDLNVHTEGIISNSIDEEEQQAEETNSENEEESDISSDDNSPTSVSDDSQSQGEQVEKFSSVSNKSNEYFKSNNDEKDLSLEGNNVITEETSGAEESVANETEITSSQNKLDKISSSLPSFSFDSSNNLKKLMAESTEVAQELQNVFKVLHDREAKLMAEVIRLKEALTGAVAIVSSKSKSETNEAIKRCKKRMTRRSHRSPNEDPYKACVYIEPSAPEYSSRTSSSGSKQSLASGNNSEEIYPPEPSVRVYFPVREENSSSYKSSELKSASSIHEDDDDEESSNDNDNNIISHEEEELEENHKTKAISSHSSHSSSSSSGDQDIDFDKVYWLELPTTDENYDEKALEDKVEEVISEVKHDGNDALIIPVSHGSHTPNKRGFVKALKPNPTLKKKLRRHLRRSIRHAKKREAHEKSTNNNNKKHMNARSTKAIA